MRPLAACLLALWCAGASAIAAERRDDRDRETPAAERPADVRPIAIVGADIYPVTSPPVPGGTLLMSRGRIERILPAPRAGTARVPEGYEVIEAAGRRVYPGLVVVAASALDFPILTPDAHVGGTAEALGHRLADNVDAWSAEMDLAASAGITSVLVYRPAFGRPAPLSARAAVVKMSFGEPRGLLLREPAAVVASSALLDAKGREQVRRMIADAREWGRDRDRKPNAVHELVLDLAGREMPLLVPADSGAEVLATLELARELELDVVLYHPTDAWALAEELARARVPVVQHARMNWWKARPDRRLDLEGGWRLDAPSILKRAGIAVTVSPLDEGLATWGVPARDLLNLPIEAAFAQRGGLSAQEALEAITIVPARLLGLEHRIGSIAPGKDADLLIADGDVLDYRTWVRTTIVNGRVAYRAEGHRFWDWAVTRRDATLKGEPFPADLAAEAARGEPAAP